MKNNPDMKKASLIIPLLLAILFPLLLHRQQAGLNVLLFDTVIIGLLLFTKRIKIARSLNMLLSSGVMLSGLMVLIYGSTLAVAANVVSLILLTGSLALPDMAVLLNGFIASVVAVITGPFRYLGAWNQSISKSHWWQHWIRFGGFIMVPIIILIVFILLYSAASPYFNKLTGNFVQMLVNLNQWIATFISPDAFWIGMAGLFIGFSLFYGKFPFQIKLLGETGNDEQKRVRRKYSGSILGLKTEAKTAILMFVLLNLLIAVMNVLDLYYVWFNFEWDGGFLKQFVHEGTWLLILSIFISMSLVLWYFRGNLNFFSRNRSLIILTRIWLAQNALLTLSVAMRNYWYLHYFNLAFKRIWVFAFLVLVLLGLLTVMLKVERKKSLRYLLIRNSLFAYCVFMVLSLFNWDVIIARFNVNRSEKAFFHTNFMMSLHSSALPVLLMDDQKLQSTEVAQKKLYPYHGRYMSLTKYNNVIRERKRDFLAGYPQMHWLSFTVADYRTSQKLMWTQSGSARASAITPAE